MLLAAAGVALLGAGTAAGDIQLISRSPAGAYGDGPTITPSISANGARVAFESMARNLGPVTDAAAMSSIFVWDSASSTVLLGAHSNTGGPNGNPPPNDDTMFPSLTADGLQVAFTSGGSNIFPTLTFPNRATFRSFVDPGGSTYLVGRDSGGALSPPGGTSVAALSGDGTWATVLSGVPSEMLGGSPPSGLGIFRTPACCHLVSNELVNHIPGDATTTDDSASNPRHVALSYDGSRIVFASQATNLVPGTNPSAARNIYVWSADTHAVQLVSRASGPAGAPGDGTSINPAISADGRYVSFESNATNLDPTVTALYANPDQQVLQEVYVRDLDLQTTTVVSLQNGPAGAPMNDTRTGLDTTNATSISGDGRYVAFTSPATDLSNEDCRPGNVAYADVFLRDRVANTTTLISRASRRDDFCNNATGVNGDSEYPQLSADATKLAFISWGNNIGPVGNPLKVRNAYLADTGVTATPVTAPVVTPPATTPPVTPAAVDTTAPTVSKLKIAPAVFAVLKAKGASIARASKRPHRGATITFTTTEAGAARFDVLTRPAGASRAKRKVVRPKPRKVGSLKRAGTVRGRNRVAFAGVVAGKALKPGTYTLRVTVTDAAGNSSRVATTTFRIVAAR